MMKSMVSIVRIHPTKGWKNVFKTCVCIPVCFSLSQSVEQYTLNTFFHPFVGCIMVVLLQLIPYLARRYRSSHPVSRECQSSIISILGRMPALSMSILQCPMLGLC